MKKLKVAVLMGGKSPEHEISVISGREVVRSLDKEKYDILPVVINKKGDRWQIVSPNQLDNISDPLSYKGTSNELLVSKSYVQSPQALSGKVDVVFIAMHGPFGEDGTVQGMLDLAGIAYTGPGVLASALGMDKYRFRMIMEASSIRIPKYVVLSSVDESARVYQTLGKPPYFVKPHNQGSSLGMSKVRFKKHLKEALKKALAYSDTVLVDEYLEGKEVTCAIIGNDDPQALPLVEIIPNKGEFFDYLSKYEEGGADEIVPARISEKMTTKVHNIAIEVYKLVGCTGFSRIDFILKGNRSPYVLEVNTVPGLTPMSLFPKAAKEYGLEYSQLLDKIINYADVR